MLFILIFTVLVVLFIIFSSSSTEFINKFSNVYKNKVWGDDKNDSYTGSSGTGSDVEYNRHTYIPFIKKFILDKNIKTVVDLGCGNFICGQYIYDDLDVKYTGYDAYEDVIKKHKNDSKYEFIFSDFYTEKESIKSADLCIVKDVLQHWPLRNIRTFMDYIVKSNKFKYILVCNCAKDAQDDIDIDIGEFRPLSADKSPLNTYNLNKVYEWDTKEVSILKI